MTDWLGTSLPIIQAPMAGAQVGALAVAVSTAGALGSLPCAMLSVDEIRREIINMKAQTDRPFNVNFFCHEPPVVDVTRERAWREVLAPYYREFAIDPATIAPGAGRRPFDAEMAIIVEEFRPAVVSFHFGLPAADLLHRVRATGAKILSSATTIEEARWLEGRGVDGIIAQGNEAGGHRGMFLTDDLTTQVGTYALVPQMVKAVRVPIIAAGGIADASGVRAALLLGASCVQVGSAYLLCPEAITSPIHRRTLTSDAARHTALTNVFTGRPARSIVNRLVREIGPMSTIVPAFPLATAAIMPLRSKAEEQGSGDFSPLWAGQNVSGARPVRAAQLTRELCA